MLLKSPAYQHRQTQVKLKNFNDNVYPVDA